MVYLRKRKVCDKLARFILIERITIKIVKIKYESDSFEFQFSTLKENTSQQQQTRQQLPIIGL